MGPLLTRIQAAWLGLDGTKRIALIVLAVGVAGTIALWTVLGSQVPYEVAFGNVKQADAAPIVAKLKELQIPYELQTEADGTTTIRVPTSMADEARVQVAGAGLLQGNTVGYEIFNQPSFGISDFIQQVDYQRALEGELARSIAQIDAVDSARVHLAIPQPSLFVSEQRDPSAAIMIGLKPGRQMDQAQAKAIVNLVVGAVAGMKPTGVVLLDTQGHLLHATGDASAPESGTVGDQYTTERSMENDLESRLQDMLDRVVGPGKSTAQVTMELDWTTGDVTSQTYLPNNQQPALQSEQVVQDIQPAGASTVGGIPGVTSNVPVYQAAATPATPTSAKKPSGTPSAAAGVVAAATTPASQHLETNRTFQLSQTTQKTQLRPGTVKRLSVAVVVDSTAVNSGEIAQLTTMVQTASGYDSARGDSVSVIAVPMKASTPTVAANPAASQMAQTLALARIGALAIGPLLAILALAFLLLRRRPSAAARAGTPEVLPPPAAPFLPPLSDPAQLPLTVDERRLYVREQLGQLAQRHPAAVAAALQSWIEEEGEGRS